MPTKRNSQAAQGGNTAMVIAMLVVLMVLAGVAVALVLKKPPGAEAGGGSGPTVEAFFDFTPAPASIFIDGERRAFTPGDPINLTVGDHLLEVATPGYLVIETPITIKSGADNRFEFELIAEAGVLTVTSPVPAKVEIDGEPVGETPVVEVELEPGSHSLTADAGKEFEPIERVIEIEGARQRQKVELEFSRSWAWVTVNSNPQGLRVLDASNKLIGLTGQPIKAYGRAAPYNWTIDGEEKFQDIAVPIRVRAGVDVTLGPFAREERYVKLRLETDPPGAPIAINGIPLDQVTPVIYEVPANREIKVAFISDKFEPWSQVISSGLRSGGELKIFAELTPLNSELNVRTVPRGAEVYFDGQLLGMTPLVAELPVGKQSLTIKRLGYKTKSVEAELRSNASNTIEVILER